VNARLSNGRVAGIRTQQASRMRPFHEHLRGSWRCIGERALKRLSSFKAYWRCAMSCVQRDADTMPGLHVGLGWIPVRSVVV
jgi:hypothetical protein